MIFLGTLIALNEPSSLPWAFPTFPLLFFISFSLSRLDFDSQYQGTEMPDPWHSLRSTAELIVGGGIRWKSSPFSSFSPISLLPSPIATATNIFSASSPSPSPLLLLLLPYLILRPRSPPPSFLFLSPFLLPYEVCSSTPFCFILGIIMKCLQVDLHF